MSKLTVRFQDHVYVRVSSEEKSLLHELQDHFSFEVPGARFSPAYRKRHWDGKIKLFHLYKQRLYAGLVPSVQSFAAQNNYQVSLEGFPSHQPRTQEELRALLADFEIPAKYEVREYQLEAVQHCLNSGRALLVSPTASGKSLIIYCLLRLLDKPTLIVVPNTTLIHQLAQDFQDYGYTGDVHKIYAGQDKSTLAQITLTTWQSVYKQPQAWFEKYSVIIGDEAHRCKAKSLVELFEKTPTIPHRFGFTGSLDESLTNRMVLEGLFGPVKKIIETRELIDQGYLAKLKIKGLVLTYPEETRKAFKSVTYQNEIDWLVANPHRNAFIRDLALNLKGNTLILYRYVEKHGIPLHKLFEGTENVYLVNGKVAAEDRDEIRRIVNAHDNSITLASMGTFSEGINIPRMNNIIFASPSKSRILVMQMIGRGLRKAEDKTVCNVYDIADQLSHKKRLNHTFKHYLIRVKYYVEEKFPFQQFLHKL